MFALESPAVWLGHGYLQLVAAASSGLAESTAEGTAGGEILGQVAEPDETRQAITFLIVCLVGIALLLAVLTVWYWHFTSPKRRASALLDDLGHYESDPAAAMPAPESPPMLAGVGGPSAAPDHLRLPAPAPAPAIDDRTTSAPAFAAAGPTTVEPGAVAPRTVEPAGTPPLTPPKLPTNTPRRHVEPAPARINRPVTVKRGPATPRRIEVAARTATNGPAGRTDGSGESAEPIFPDRVPKVDRKSSADSAPPPVETKTGTSAPPDPAPTAPRTAKANAKRPATAKRPAAVSPPPAAHQQSKRSAMPPVAAKTSGAAAGQEGLSDDDWAAVMQSAFSKLQK